MFGTKITDEFFGVHTGGDVAFLNGVHEGAARHRRHRQARSSPSTRSGSTACSTSSRRSPFDRLDELSGATRADMDAVRRACTPRPRRRCSCGRWASRSTRPVSTTCGRSSTSALARGNVGRPGAGLMPIRGHSGVQGGAEMGCYATAFPGGVPINAAERRRARARSGASRCRRRAGSTRRRWSRPRGAATSTCSGRAAATSSTCSPRPTSPAPRWRARRCACTRTSC